MGLDVRMSIIVAVTGSRVLQNATQVTRELAAIHRAHGISMLLTGHCGQGPDLYAEDFAKINGIQSILLPAPWRSARGILSGFDRNGKMLDIAMMLAKPQRPQLLAFATRCTLSAPKCTNPKIHMTHGTRDCVLKAKELPITIKLYRDETFK